MKGPPGKIKTTINPIKTLTPRFITKALEKSNSLNNFNKVMFFFPKDILITFVVKNIFIYNLILIV